MHTLFIFVFGVKWEVKLVLIGSFNFLVLRDRAIRLVLLGTK